MNRKKLENLATKCCNKTYSGYVGDIGIYEPFTNAYEQQHSSMQFIAVILVIILIWFIYKHISKKR